MSFYVGIDGGGTKTQYALFDEKKTMLATVKTRGSNHENLEGSFTEMADIICEGIDLLLSEKGLSRNDISEYLMALAGIDHEYQREALDDELTERGLKNFRIYNDGYIIIKAGSPSGVGIGYNCGTGNCCNSADSRGKLLQVGGFGELSGDMGNGYWIARRTFRAAYDDICLGVKETVITKMICEKFGIAPERDALLGLIPLMEAINAEKYVMGLIDIFLEAGAAGDEAALEIAEEMAVRGAQFINSHLIKQQFDAPCVDVVLSGSIHTKLPSDFYISMMKEKTEALSGRKLNFIKLSVPPVTGCINWMLEK